MAYVGFYGTATGDNITPSSDVSVSGVVAKSGIQVTMTPPADSSAVVFGHKSEMIWRTDNNLTPGGWISAYEGVVSLAGSGNVDKVVCAMTQFNNINTGVADKVLGMEAVVSALDPLSTVNQYAAFYVANASVVPNINRILQFSAFQSDYTEAKNSFLHPSYGGARQDLAPAFMAKVLPGRYYSSPAASTVAPGTLTLGRMEVCPFFVNDRTTFTRVGINITTAVAASTVRLALYNASGLVALTKVNDYGTVDSSTTGVKEITISQRLDSGVYWLVAMPSASGIGASFHTIVGPANGLYGASSATAGPDVSVYGTATFGVAPDTLTPTANVGATTEVHLWMRAV